MALFKISKRMIIAAIVSTPTSPDSNPSACETREVYQRWSSTISMQEHTLLLRFYITFGYPAKHSFELTC